MNIVTRLTLFLSLSFLNFVPGFAQHDPIEQIARQHILANLEKWNLQSDDIADLYLADRYESRHNGVTHLYFHQRYKGIEIKNAILNLNIAKDGAVLHTGNRLENHITQKVNAGAPLVSAEAALMAAARHFGLTAAKPAVFKSKKDGNVLVYEKSNIAENDIPVRLMYEKSPEGLRLVWNLLIDRIENADYWSVNIDALTGEFFSKNNHTVYCNHENLRAHFASHDHEKCGKENRFFEAENAADVTAMEGTYRVFALPVESPLHGARSLVENPADAEASPFGWHDTDGVMGPEYTITRGNNAHAFQDSQNRGASVGDEPDGGAGLVFDFPYDPDFEPVQMRNAAVTNLFYLSNVMHDVAYQYGFDEPAGSFQFNNYGNGGWGGDYVIAQAQDGDGTNNANFTALPDGSTGIMQMYLWDRNGIGSARLLEITAPSQIAGFYGCGTAQYGPPVSENNPIRAEIVEARDDFFDPSDTDGCEMAINNSQLRGKIVLVDRGGCYYEQKTVVAEQSGALAVIVCNFDNSTIDMGGRPEIPNPNIPTISISSGDCALIRQYLSQGAVSAVVTQPPLDGPERLDGDFDNGVIAHEYGHGISHRLTGGPGTTSCLDNEEQMGEGWSDFFTLSLFAKPGDTGSDRRGIATYSLRDNIRGKGNRTYPYSTDMNVNPLTYNDISQLTIPHGLGSVWCSMLWDLYWALIEKYGFDEDVYHGTGGNNRAIQLVMDGMKMQSCSPGFVDGRDAILAADRALYNGENQCLIWQVFARRGLGYFAEQGDTDNAGDGKESYETLPTCIKELKIAKTATPFIQAGDEIIFSIKVINHKDETAGSVVVTDELPDGLTFLELTGAAGINPNQVVVNTNLPGLVTFEIGDMPTGKEITLTYKARSRTDKYSKKIYLDRVPDNSPATEIKWEVQIQSEQDISSNIWALSNEQAHNDTWSWHVDDHPKETRQVLQLSEPISITGTQPVLRFYHNYQSFPGQHGGVVEVSEDLRQWKNLDTELFRNKYTGLMTYKAFNIPKLFGFSGSSNGFVDSYADLSVWKGKDVSFRFRFGTRDTIEFSGFAQKLGSKQGGFGWFVDDFEIMDLFNYNGEVCVRTNTGDEVCTLAPDKGTLVDSKEFVGVQNLDVDGSSVTIFPNPARDYVQLKFDSKYQQKVEILCANVDGKLLRRESFQLRAGRQIISFELKDQPAGLYFLKVKTDGGSVVEKIIKR